MTRKHNVDRSWLNGGVMVFLLVVSSSAQDQYPRTNLQVMEDLFQRLSHDIIQQALLHRGDSVAVEVASSAEPRVFGPVFQAALKNSGIIVFSKRDSLGAIRASVTIPTTTMTVRYSNLSRDGFFGAKKVDRDVSAVATVEIEDALSHEILSSGNFSQSLRDTIELDDIPKLEQESIRWTHAEAPHETTLDRIIEPFVILGATGVAIFLFFHIRS